MCFTDTVIVEEHRTRLVVKKSGLYSAVCARCMAQPNPDLIYFGALNVARVIAENHPDAECVYCGF